MNLGTLTIACLSLVLGQTPDDLVYQNQRTVKVPINIEQSRRAELKALVLYASDDLGRSYHEVASILPAKNEFVFNAPADGVFWLKAAVINLQGKQEPDNIQNGPPHQKLVIDTLKPQLRLSPVQRQGDEVAISWEIKEDHPDWKSFRLEFQNKDAVSAPWNTIPATAGLTGNTQFKPGNGSALLVRLVFMDLAGNQSGATVEVPGTLVTTGFTQNNGPDKGLDLGKPKVTPPPQGNPLIQVPLEAPPPLFPEKAAEQGKPKPPPGSSWTPLPNGPGSSSEQGKPVTTNDPPPNAISSVPPLPQSKPLPPLQYVNHPRVQLEYELNKVGPSGIGKVELWYTTNDGQSWELCADDPRVEGAVSGGKHQRAIDLPGDGIYGFHLVVKSRAGLGKAPPRPGDPPQIRFEVDTSVPVAQLFPPTPDPLAPGALLLRWTAKDNNLAEAPISLEWSERREGPWTPIAVNIPNTGKHSWQLPDRMPVQAFLRIRARDMAGNEGVAVTSEAQIIDLSEPEGRLLNVTVSPKR